MTTQQNPASFEIDRLLDAAAFPHVVDELTLIETHISWVILTGQFAYKIKKPVRFDFVDYSTLESRRQYCHHEVSLNRRFAAELYLGVVPIVVAQGQYTLKSDVLDEMSLNNTATPASEVIEYAVKMQQFPQESIVAAKLNHPQLSPAAIDRFGREIARFHKSIESLPDERKVDFAVRFHHDLQDNFVVLREAFAGHPRQTSLQQLEQWIEQEFADKQMVIQSRCQRGMVRKCHGDLHLKNIIQLNDRLIAFDGIEFNEDLQWIDVVNEIAFTVMDFSARGRSDLGWRLLNSWWVSMGIDDGLQLLRLFVVYRALVRAKVTWLNPHNHQRSEAADTDDSANADCLPGPWNKYLETAATFAFKLKRKLAITHGFSASGKSTLATRWIATFGGLQLRSDVERLRMDSISSDQRYSDQGIDAVYNHLLTLTREIVDVGLPVIVDATFLKLKHRRMFMELADELDLSFEIVHADAPFAELCDRIRRRKGDPSEATVEVLKQQIETHDPLTEQERQHVKSP